MSLGCYLGGFFGVVGFYVSGGGCVKEEKIFDGDLSCMLFWGD